MTATWPTDTSFRFRCRNAGAQTRGRSYEDRLAGVSTTVIVPLRSPGHGKTRLRGHLSPDQRAALATAMFADVIAALTRAGMARIVVAARGQAAIEAARDHGIEWLADPGRDGLDAAIAAASVSVTTHGLLVVAADLPRLTAAEVRAVTDRDESVVVAPTRGGGTGALLRRPAAVIGTSYGPDSARAHLEAATAAGLTSHLIDRPGFRADIDTAADLAELGQGPVGPATRDVLEMLAVQVAATAG